MEETILTIGNEYLKSVIGKFNSVKKLGDDTIRQLTEEDLH